MKNDFVSCRECVDLLFDYLESSLDPQTLKRLDEHLAACPPCINFLKTYKSCQCMGQQMREQKVNIPPQMEERLKSFLRAEIKSSETL